MVHSHHKTSWLVKDSLCFQWKIVSFTFLGLAIAALVTGCNYFEGYAVQAYLKDVARIQMASETLLLNLEQDLAGLDGDIRQVEEATTRLNAERSAVDAARLEIESLEAPEAAMPLESHLLDLYSEGSNLLGELASNGTYRLATEPIFSQYESASASFSEKIKSASDIEEITLCLREYESFLASLAEQAKLIESPTISTRSHLRFLTNLDNLRSGLSETISALENDDKAALEAASAKMAAIDSGGEQLQQQINSEREADIKDYNAQINRLRELVAQIGQDQVELHQRFDRT